MTTLDTAMSLIAPATPATPATTPRVLRIGPNPQAVLGGRDLIVGDVHGCFGKLRLALEKAAFRPDLDRLFSVGDLVDRGPESADVLWWLQQPWFRAIAGNHEAMALMYHAGEMPPGMLAQNGGAWFIGMTREERQPYADAFAELPVAIELETAGGLVGLVHADCPFATWEQFTARLALGGPAARNAIDAAQWSRSRCDFMDHEGVGGVRAVVVGHTPMERPTTLGNVHFIDTGAWLKGGKTGRDFCLLDAATLSPAVTGPGATLSWPAELMG